MRSRARTECTKSPPTTPTRTKNSLTTRIPGPSVALASYGDEGALPSGPSATDVEALLAASAAQSAAIQQHKQQHSKKKGKKRNGGGSRPTPRAPPVPSQATAPGFLAKSDGADLAVGRHDDLLQADRDDLARLVLGGLLRPRCRAAALAGAPPSATRAFASPEDYRAAFAPLVVEEARAAVLAAMDAVNDLDAAATVRCDGPAFTGWGKTIERGGVAGDRDNDDSGGGWLRMSAQTPATPASDGLRPGAAVVLLARMPHRQGVGAGAGTADWAARALEGDDGGDKDEDDDHPLALPASADFRIPPSHKRARVLLATPACSRLPAAVVGLVRWRAPEPRDGQIALDIGLHPRCSRFPICGGGCASDEAALMRMTTATWVALDAGRWTTQARAATGAPVAGH